jgi:Na+/proline symporter
MRGYVGVYAIKELSRLQVSLGWVYLFMGVLIGSAVIPISLSLMWTRITAPGMVVGAVSGSVAGLASWLGFASTYPGGLSEFFTNTGETPQFLYEQYFL